MATNIFFLLTTECKISNSLFVFVCLPSDMPDFNLIIYGVFNFGYNVLYGIDKGDDDDHLLRNHHHHHKNHKRTICTMTSFYFYCQRPPGSVTKNIARI